jgi:hypothetical protein
MTRGGDEKYINNVKMFAEKPGRKRSFVRTKCRREDGSEMGIPYEKMRLVGAHYERN